MPKILLIEDDVTFSAMLERFLKKNDFTVEAVYSSEEASKKLTNTEYDLVFTDLRLPDDDGISILTKVKEKYPETPVILMTGYAQVSTAVKAMKKGAFDYISKPFNQDEVLIVIQNALKNGTAPSMAVPTSTKAENIATADDSPTKTVTGISSASSKLNEYIKLVAPTDMSVLITGDSGTGKEVVAKRIHDNSNRKELNFIAVDCGAIPKEIAASEFFGHVKGSFTGAVNNKVGHFEAANGGTIFLDEVGNLSYENQIQLLRALQERKIKPIGSNHEIEVDIRLITATNEDLLKAVEKGQFREDLYHRLNEFSIKVPSLHERKEDLLLFADHFLNMANAQLNKNVLGFSDEVIGIFQQYKWPGNLREMSNVIKRSALLTQGDLIEKNVLPVELTLPQNENNKVKSFSRKENERDLIINALNEVGNNKSKAAKLLNITRKTLYNKIKEYQIDA
ncbi:sigma-54-dependent transcriptional regulator [Galbibacter pacificus]|uniref:Sigma-54 dependent transcriptional regulator n=1 Tax=Galbibacter pacificus TaxID=2996052 RepID=A0ABT6FTX0_9FLAO|nr:sigma-54 dependent transcriptional regulator [Galbibacter pacificus]MDG3583055.1 sigma-54 dependent transcriptional regulator [Galbibacter pacificus]MDG3586536.1 sigma-54 dependent transcriptional regulator [Galbibacter pacificus]